MVEGLLFGAVRSRRQSLAHNFDRVRFRYFREFVVEALMSIFEPIEVVAAEGFWRVQINVSADGVEYITHNRAVKLAEEFESEGWGECAVRLRAAAATARALEAAEIRPS